MRIRPAALLALLVMTSTFFGPEGLPAQRTVKPVATDLPGAIVTVWSRGRMKRVNDFDDRLEPLRALEARIDSVAGSSRWARPSTIR